MVVLQDPITHLDNGHLRSKSGKGLSHFNTNGAGSYNGKMVGLLVEFKQLMVCEMRNAVEPVDRRDERPSTGRNDDPVAAHVTRTVLMVNSNGVVIHKASGAVGHLNPHVFKDFRGVGIVVHLLAQCLHPVHDGGEVNARFRHLYAVFVRFPHRVGHLSTFQERLAGDAAVPGAVATELGFLNH